MSQNIQYRLGRLEQLALKKLRARSGSDLSLDHLSDSEVAQYLACLKDVAAIIAADLRQRGAPACVEIADELDLLL